MDDPSTVDLSRILNVLEALKQASHDLQHNHHSNSAESDSVAIKALLELETESNTILSKDPNLSSLSQHLTNLKSLVETLRNTKGYSLTSFLTRRASTQSISRVAESIGSEIQAWIDRESLENLTKALKDDNFSEDELVSSLTQFEDRVARGFDRELQGLVLKSKVFSLLEIVLCNSNRSMVIRRHCASAIAGLIQFNKDVFVGQVLMGQTIPSLLNMSCSHSLKIICLFIKLIKSPLVDEIESNGGIPKIISFLNAKELETRVVAMDCVLEIGYFGRKEAVEAMLREGLIEKLIVLQRSDLGGDLIDIGRFDDNDKEHSEEGKRESRQARFIECHPFASCVARFAVQLEVGEGLRQRERRAFKQEILDRVRKESLSDAESATIIAEVLWGSSP